MADLPPEALGRLEKEASRLTPQTLAAGGLSVNAAALLNDSGFQPIGQVMGLSIFQIGLQWVSGGWKNSDRQKMQNEGLAYELTTSTQSLYQARHLAMSRLKQEAQILGAVGVAGVELTHRSIPGEGSTIEFKALGTAIRERGRKAQGEPFLSNLSGADLWSLHQAGFTPVGLCMGNCSYLMVPDYNTQQILVNGALTRKGRQNQEFSFMTRAVYEARELAMSRMESEAHSYGASSIINATIEIETAMGSAPNSTPQNTWNAPAMSLSVHFLALGTAIAPRRERDLKIEQAFSLK